MHCKRAVYLLATYIPQSHLTVFITAQWEATVVIRYPVLSIQVNTLNPSLFFEYFVLHRITQLHHYVRWWFGLAVARWSRSTKLLYARPG